MRFDRLPVLVLQQKRERSLKRPGRPARERRRVAAGLNAVAGSLEADQPHARVVEEGVEDPDGVGSSADARGDGVGQSSGLILDLYTRLEPDDTLEVADHRRERMRPGGGAEAVGGACGAGDPVAGTL